MANEDIHDGISLTSVVRVATEEDAAVVARLMIGFRDWQGRDEPSDASIQSSVRRLIADPNTTYLLAGGEDPVGVLQLRFRHSVWTGTDDAHLEDLFVEERARGTGMGRALVEAALERARERGCARMELDANEANVPAVALYRSIGFESWSEAAGGHNRLMRLRL
jgi:ribosomal protein S18 acetylase RimI-like enzyme